MALISDETGITDKDFFNALDLYLVEITKEAHPYTSKTAILQRLLYTCSNILNIDLNWYQSKNIIQIHSDNILKIDGIWQKINSQEMKITHDEENVYKILKNSDFIHVLDIQKIINILVNKNEEIFLAELLAVDGFHGNFKNYIDNLKIGHNGNTHIHVIRNIYKEFKGCTVRIIYLILLKIFIRFVKDDEIKQLVLITIHELENDVNEMEKNILNSNMEKITTLYINNVENIESIAMLKMAQLKIKNKKAKNFKTQRKKEL